MTAPADGARVAEDRAAPLGRKAAAASFRPKAEDAGGSYLKPPVIAKNPLILSFVSRSRAARVRTNVQSRS